jgi:hypothetical protein
VLGVAAAMWMVAALTFGSGVVVALRMTETLHGPFLTRIIRPPA